MGSLNLHIYSKTAKTFEYEETEKGLFVKRIYENMKKIIKHYDIQDRNI